jgi:hypothetical protein
LNGLALWLGRYRVAYFDEVAHAFTTFAVALGTLWEVGEWLYERAVPGEQILGKADTMSDLVWDGVGAMLAGLCKAVSDGESGPRRFSPRRA